jgi:NADH-quinone oxidoreductase subunit K
MTFIIFLLIIGLLCLITKNNILLFFIALELIILAINLNFIFFSLSLNDSQGYFLALILLALAACDTAIGLSLLLKFFRKSLQGESRISSLMNLKG